MSARRNDEGIRNLNFHRGILPLASTRVAARAVATVAGRRRRRRRRVRWRRFEVAKAQTVRVHREFCAMYPQVNTYMCVYERALVHTRERVGDLIFFFAATATTAARF